MGRKVCNGDPENYYFINMKFIQTSIIGAYRIELEKKVDDRGFFARTWDSNEFKKRGLSTEFVQASMSSTSKSGTLRGMHFQKPPHAENKLIRVTRGIIYDVMIDLREHSQTYMQWFGTELSDTNRLSLYIPEGIAHGFITLSDNVELHYFMTAYYEPEAQSGVRYDDPAFNIKWPIEVAKISKKDASYPDFRRDSV